MARVDGGKFITTASRTPGSSKHHAKSYPRFTPPETSSYGLWTPPWLVELITSRLRLARCILRALPGFCDAETRNLSGRGLQAHGGGLAPLGKCLAHVQATTLRKRGAREKAKALQVTCWRNSVFTGKELLLDEQSIKGGQERGGIFIRYKVIIRSHVPCKMCLGTFSI